MYLHRRPTEEAGVTNNVFSQKISFHPSQEGITTVPY
jgi:hypothetical protein